MDIFETMKDRLEFMHDMYNTIKNEDGTPYFDATFLVKTFLKMSEMDGITLKRRNMKVQIINKSKHNLPFYATDLSAGMDLKADIDEPIKLKPLERTIVPTGLYMALPEGYEAQVRPRSGLAAKFGITVLNAPGTIDADYRGEVGVILVNLSDQPFIINPGERIAQMVVARYGRVEWEEVSELSETERGIGGFGSTGK